jgi:hypothetical protein
MIHNDLGYITPALRASTTHAPLQQMVMKRRGRLVGGALVAWLFAALSASSLQAQPVAGAQRATRAELSQQLAAAEQSVATLQGGAREQAQQQVLALRSRLDNGDFRVGDRFVITFIRDTVFSDTASVREGLVVTILNLPDLSVKGVLRSELNETVSAHVARYLLNTTVRTNVLTRVGIFGAVQAPGYYLSSPDRPVSELVMLAGGPQKEANLDRMEIERGGRKILSARDAKRAMGEGKTLEQLDIQSGDDVRIPEKRKINWQLVFQLFFIISSVLFAFIQFLQWYYGRNN